MNATCPECGKPVAPNALQGLCPDCMMKVGLGSEIHSRSAAGGATGKPMPFVAPSVAELAPMFPQLEILALIGQGGMGAVYRARQKELDRVVALKILPPGIGQDAAFGERFTREARALARLNHPGIVTLYEFGRAEGLFYFLMEYVDGASLRQLLQAGRVAPREALALVPQICDALQYAHDQSIIHRDIKPENILVDRRGRVKVADFGLAKLVGAAAEPTAAASGAPTSPLLTAAGVVMGTPHYMAPEQREHPGEADHRVDIYAVGMVFYEMLTGQMPGKPIEPPSHKVQIDMRLDEVVLRALEREPERRFQHVSELKTSMETIALTPASQAGAKAVGQPAGGPPRFSRRLLIPAAVVMLAIVAGVVLAVVSKAPRRERVEPGPQEVVAQTIRNQVGRELREAGASYDTLQVMVAIRRDSAPPFNVSYSGLRNFKGSDGTTPNANGSFVMEYIGRGQWQGALAGTRFTVTVASRDKIDLPFVGDPQVVGKWKSVDFVADPSSFDPEQPAWIGELYLTGLTFLENGKMPAPGQTWTKGFLINQQDQTASHYEIREVKGRAYLFLEWKSGDVTIAGRKPYYYVLRRAS
jgi:predicted Ser/Thr protein kinase